MIVMNDIHYSYNQIMICTQTALFLLSPNQTDDHVVITLTLIVVVHGDTRAIFSMQPRLCLVRVFAKRWENGAA
jgi:hypothetical protein